MAFIVNEPVEEYAAEHTTQLGELFDRLAAETREKTTAPQMMVGRIEGGFLATLVRLTGAKRILELGTFTGYSSISMASALPSTAGSSRATSIPEATAIARRYMDESGSATGSRSVSALRSTRSDARRPVRHRLHRRGQAELQRRTTRRCYRCSPRTECSSPTTCSGRVASSRPTATSRRRRSRHFNEHVANDDRVVSVMLTVRDGMTLVQLRSGALLK